MKPKKITKKLTLNKETIVELNKSEKKGIKGGRAHTRQRNVCDSGTCPEAPE